MIRKTLHALSGLTLLLLGGLFFVDLSSGAFASRPDPITSDVDPGCGRRPIDLVICLDTSGSMMGLIDSARARLWDIVNSLSKAKPTPQLRVGLLTYGSPSRSTASQGWVVKQTDLTSDLDSVYSVMMGLSTDGGDEFVGWVLNDAVNRMSWSNDPRAMKLIFVAGNESADQASEVYNFRNVGRLAHARGITVNSIYCGAEYLGNQEHWAEVAVHGCGNYSAIDMHCGTVQVEAPQDKLLLELNMKLNATYVPFGAHGDAGQRRQVEQDANAGRLGEASRASRVEAKATALYANEKWDLVDAVAKKEAAVKDLKDTDLPAAMQTMSVVEREKYVETQTRTRGEIQRRISEISGERERFLKSARAKVSGGKTALDQALLETLRKQAEEKGFKFDE